MKGFVATAIRHPAQTGAIVPSSASLARAMVDAAAIRPGHRVVELGAGNGAFTREVVQRHPESPLAIFEISPTFAECLRRAFPQCHVLAESAEHMDRTLDELGWGKADRVVSGLPWALWGEEQQVRILDAVVSALAPGGRFVTFHYVHSRALGRVFTMRRLLQERFRRVWHEPVVWTNLPPAFAHVADGPLGGGPLPS
jgi:phospholipid N-methyltransferase